MNTVLRVALALILSVTAALAGSAAFPDSKETGAFGPAQSAADVLRSYAGADGAFLAAGLIKDSYQKDNLATLLLYPDDELVVVRLTGNQLKEAFERSVSLYPQPNTSFLQLSGFEVTFNKSAPVGKRVVSVTAGGSRLDDSKFYMVAMPASLGRGGLGYFKIWDKPNIVKTFDKVSVESILKGKPYAESPARWSASG